MTYLVFDVVIGQASFSYTETSTYTAETRELERSNTYPGGWPYVSTASHPQRRPEPCQSILKSLMLPTL